MSTEFVRPATPEGDASPPAPATAPAEPTAAESATSAEAAASPEQGTLAEYVRYFLKLGTIGFGGPPALAGFMHRDLVERRGWVSDDTYRLSLALAQMWPGPMAAQLAIALGYFQRGVLGASLIGLAFVLPSFFMVVAISMLYVAYGGLWWMQALFYGIGAGVIAIIAIAAYKLSRSTNRRDPLLWGIFTLVAADTASGASRAGGDRGDARAAPADPAVLHESRRFRLRERVGGGSVPLRGDRP